MAGAPLGRAGGNPSHNCTISTPRSRPRNTGAISPARCHAGAFDQLEPDPSSPLAPLCARSCGLGCGLALACRPSGNGQ